jgi:AcrR family transcriptional regulator
MTGIRAEQKRSTQARILESARNLMRTRSFDEVGVREIAEGAGVAAGTVIASFGSKNDVLERLMIEDFEIQKALALQAGDGYEHVCERLLAILYAGFDYQSGQIGLLRASLAAWYHLDSAAVARLHDALNPVLKMVAAELVRAQGLGQLRAEIDPRLAAIVLFDCLICTYRIAIHSADGFASMRPSLKSRLELALRGLLAPDVTIHIAKAA